MTTDVFDDHHPCQRQALEIRPMTTTSNGHDANGTTALIAPPGPASIREMVQTAMEALGYPLSRELSLSDRERIARRAGVTERQVKSAVEGMRRRDGIQTQTRPRKQQGRRGMPSRPNAAPTSEPAPDRTPAAAGMGSQSLARVLAVELAGELLQAARDGDETQRTALLLQAGALLQRVL